jgi:hypothetical protein
MQTLLPGDYYWCEDCQDNHLRDCFDASPPVIGVAPWRRCYVELNERLGYRRAERESPKPPFLNNIITFQAVTFTNHTRLIWVTDGWFIAYRGHIIGLELFNTGRISLVKNSSITLTPSMGW